MSYFKTFIELSQPRESEPLLSEPVRFESFKDELEASADEAVMLQIDERLNEFPDIAINGVSGTLVY